MSCPGWRRCLYLRGLRRHMDGATGIVGRIAHGDAAHADRAADGAGLPRAWALGARADADWRARCVMRLRAL